MSKYFSVNNKKMRIWKSKTKLFVKCIKYHINTYKVGWNTAETSTNRPKAFFSPGEAFCFGHNPFFVVVKQQ